MNKTKGCLIANFATVPEPLQAGERGQIVAVQVDDRLAGRVVQIDRPVKSDLFRRFVAGDPFPLQRHHRQPLSLQFAEAGAGRRRQQVAVRQQQRQIASGAGGIAAAK
uniref:Uncharacterized protein n=1 Tax=Klebsiella pneumoniae TaxID=573 RepID=A0A6H1PVT1_KLEPN|nr:hypothetical protein [Klebsiella pneumoniae]